MLRLQLRSTNFPGEYGPKAMSQMLSNLRQWVKKRETPMARAVYNVGMWSRKASVPVIPGVHAGLYHLHQLGANSFSSLTRTLWYTPLFQSRLEKPAPGLYLYGGMPVVMGKLKMTLGQNCRVAGMMTISGRTSPDFSPELVVGDNVDLGWGSSIAVGRRIVIGNNVRLAPGILLLGYPGHPLDAEARARGDADTDEQVGDIILEDDVWLASRVIVSAGVKIGRGTIVAAGSVVTRDLPPYSLAAGAPAVVKKSLQPSES